MSTNLKTRNMTVKTLVPFLVLTFGLAWGIAALLILFTDQIVALFGEISWSHPLYILMVYAPGLAGIVLVWRRYGVKGLRSFFRRMTLWRASWPWWLFLVLGIPAIVTIAATVKGTIGDPFPYTPWHQVFPVLALALLLGPIEEFGWRGLALPLLQRKMAPIWAGIIIGLIHATWHIPAFFMSGVPYESWSIAPYVAGVVAINVIVTPLFNASRGSLLIAYLYHFQLMNPIFPDAQPWDSYLFVGVAVVIVWLNRETMFRRGSGITDVLMPERT